MKLATFASALLVVTFGAAAAWAEAQEDEARSAFQEGARLFEEAFYEEAAEQFHRAHELKPSWKILYNIAQCDAALKRYGLALESFEAYLAGGGDELAEERRDEVIAEIQRLKVAVGHLDVAAPGGARVFVDDILRGTAPIPVPIRVTAGVEHTVTVLAGIEQLLEQQLTVGSGQTVRIQAGGEEGSPGKEPVEDEEEGEGLRPLYFWIGAGATVALVAGGVAMDFAVVSKYDDATANPDDTSLRDKGKGLQAGEWVLFSLAGAAAITTGILAAFTDFDREKDEPAEATAIAPWVGPGEAGLMIEGRF